MPAVTTFEAKFITDQGIQANIVEPPSTCPRCHHGVSPHWRGASISTRFPILMGDTGTVTVSYQCPRAECGEMFLADFVCDPQKIGRAIDMSTFGQTRLPLARVYPASPQPHSFPAEVSKISPKFVAIYNEAAAAEVWGLSEIAGPGYGKALEFLIKDYLSHQTPDDAATVRKEFLGNVIASRVDDPRVKAMARGAAWLRNDETHYERRWIGKDLSDLKTLIALAVNWIHSSMLTASLTEEMGLDG